MPSNLIYVSFDEHLRIRAASDRAVVLWGLAAGEPLATYAELLEPRDLSLRSVGPAPLPARLRFLVDGTEVRGLIQQLAPGRLCFVGHEPAVRPTAAPATNGANGARAVSARPALSVVPGGTSAPGGAAVASLDDTRRAPRRRVSEAAATVRSGLDEIIASSREALDAPDPGVRAAAIRTIIQLADTLNGVTNRMLEAMADASPSGIVAIASVGAACRNAVARVGHLDGSRRVAVVHDHCCTRDAVFCDERGLVQALANLLRVLERFGGEAAAIGLEARDAPTTDAVRITLWYRGPNSEPLLGKLRAAVETDPGIAYVHTFMRATAGRFELAPEGPDGVAFCLEIPAARPARTDAEQPTRGRALVVDDQPHARGQLERYLVKLGFHVRSVASARDALTALGERMPDVLFLDLLLPDLNGADVLRMLRQKPGGRTVPVVVVSASDDVDASLALGANAHLVKPLWRDQLGAVVDRVLPPRVLPPGVPA